MLRKLASVEARYEELNRSLADPAVASDQNKLRDLSKEHADIEKLVLAYRDYTKLQADLEGAKEMAEGETDLDLVEMAKAELFELSQQSTEMEQALRILLLPKDPNDGKNVILEIRAGTGGDESALFVGELFSMYASFGNPRGWRISILSSSEGSKGGFKEIIASIEGTDVYSTMKFESGVHRVQRVPATESQGRIHTSAVTVAVLPEAEEVDLKIADNELRFDVYRSSGPGGQSVNTTDSAVRITHLPTGLVVTCQDEKSQHKNKAKGLKVLRARLLDKMEAEVHAERSAERKSLVKSGDRSDKIRTYNFPQDRLTDHRIGLTLHNLPGILGGSLEEISNALIAHFQSEALKGEGL